MSAFIPYQTNDSSTGLYSEADNDVYHSTYGALTEAYEKFVLPSNIANLIESKDNINVLDICYGIGYNSKSLINFILENYFFKEKCNNFLPYYYAIGTDNIRGQKFNKVFNFFINKQNSKKNKNDFTSNIKKHDSIISNLPCDAAIDSQNSDESLMNNQKNAEKTFDSANPKDNSTSHYYFCGDKNFCNNTTFVKKIISERLNNKRINIHAIDTDKTLMKLSPFIKENSAKKIISDTYGINQKVNKLSQVECVRNKYKIHKEVDIILLHELRKKYSDEFFDTEVSKIISDKKNKQFFDKFMLNLMKFYQNLGYKYNLLTILLALLHNIYYRYISFSNKLADFLIKNEIFKVNYDDIDARIALASSNTTYDLVFLDAFTPSKCPALWSIDFIKLLNTRVSDDCMVLTYSNAANIRNAFLQAGFYVGKIYNPETKKFTGTVASKNLDNIKYRLDDYDLGLINTKAGIVYQDKSLDLSNDEIIATHKCAVAESTLESSSKFIKRYRQVKNGL